MKNSILNFNGEEILPGTFKTIELKVSKLYNHTDVNIPVHVLHGKSEGPSVFVTAAIHGDEINGTEIIRRLMKYKVLNRLKGTLYAVPIVNVFGFLARSRYMPDRRDLNRLFPGDKKGSLGGRIANILSKNIIDRCDLGIDLHTASNHRSNLPHIRACCVNEEMKEIAKSFGAPIVVNTDTRDGSLRAYAAEQEIPILLYEAGEALRFDEASIQLGVKGVISVMRHIGMLPKLSNRRATAKETLFIERTTWVRSPSSGTISRKLKIGSSVVKGDSLAVVVDPFSDYEEVIVSPVEGVIIGCSNLPLIHEGEALFHIALTEKSKDTMEIIEESLSVEDFDLPNGN